MIIFQITKILGRHVCLFYLKNCKIDSINVCNMHTNNNNNKWLFGFKMNCCKIDFSVQFIYTL